MFKFLFNLFKKKKNKEKDYDDYKTATIDLFNLFNDYRQKNGYEFYPNILKIPTKDYYRYVTNCNDMITPKSIFDLIKESCIIFTSNKDFKIIADDKIKKMQLDNL